MAAGTAQSRRFLAPDGCSAPRLVAAGHHRSPGLCCHAQRRSPSPAAWAAGLSPHPGVPNNLVSGLRVTTAAETILAAARDLGVLDVVILGDSALRLRHCTLTDLEITARQRRRGAPLLRRVIPLLNARSESAWESIMRVLHQAAEIPVTPQQEIFDEAGRFIAVPTYGSTGLGESMSTMARGIARLMSTRSIWNATAHSSARTGNGTASPQNTCGETAPQSSPTPTACSASLESASAGCVAEPARPLALGRAGRARAYRNWRRAIAETGQKQQGESRCN